MHDIFGFLIPVALAAVAITLGFGIFALFKGGEFGRTWSNKLMQLRVAMQACAILVLVAAALFSGHGH